MPTTSRQDLDSTLFHLTITLTRDELKPKLDEEFKGLRKRAQIKGFRPGQAPAHYVKQLYGSSLFYDVFNNLVSQSLYDYLRESKVDALGQPMPVDNDRKYTFKLDNIEPEYVVTFEVGHVPEFELKGLDKSFSFKRLTVTDLDDLAEEDLNYARNRMGKRTEPEDNIDENDIIRIKSVELEKGKPKADGWETVITVFVKNVPKDALKAEILGKKKGDTLRFKISDIDPMENPDKAKKFILNIPADDNREVGDEFEGTIEEVSRIEKAELNEEFFNNYFGGGVTNETEAREQVKKGILQFYDSRADALLMRDLQTHLIDQNNFPLPDSFLKRWLTATNEGKLSAEEVERDYEAFATNLRWSMLRDKIKETADIFVTDDEIRAGFLNKIQGYFRAELPEDLIDNLLKRQMQDKEEVKKVEQDIEYEKFFGYIREQISVTDNAVTSKEFQAIFDTVSKKAEAEQQEGALLEG